MPVVYNEKWLTVGPYNDEISIGNLMPVVYNDEIWTGNLTPILF